MATAAVKKAVAARAAVGSAVELMRQELAELAAKREELVERRAAVEAAPVDRESAEGQVADLVKALAGRCYMHGGGLAHPGGYREMLRRFLEIPAAPGEGPTRPEPIWPALAAIVPDAVAAALRRGLDDEAYNRLPASLSAEARRDALAQLDNELAAVERQASELWWDGLDAGVTVPLPDVSGEALAGLEPAE
jgi:hypothetical protein